MLKLLCFLGIHSYETVQLFRAEMEFCSISLDGDVCKRCGHIPPAQVSGAKDMVSYMMVDRDIKMIIIHPGVQP